MPRRTGRRLFAANDALACGRGGVTAAAAATGLARSTINRGIQELRSGQNPIGNRVRRSGGGRKSGVTHQPGLPAALEALIEDAVRGNPCSPLRWVSRSLRQLVKALSAQRFQASQRVVANLLRDLKYSCQANLAITVTHLPPGTRKWNKIEHRLFAFITQNWRGKPPASHQVIAELIGVTTTETGLRVSCEIDDHASVRVA